MSVEYAACKRADKRASLETCRLTLKQGYKIWGKNAEIRILRIISWGCSSLVYLADANGTLCIVKELFPLQLAERGLLNRARSGKLTLSCRRNAIMLWLGERMRCWRAVKLAMKLQNIPALSNSVVQLRGLYFANRTMYTLSYKLDGRALSETNFTSMEEIVESCAQIAHMTEIVHQSGWLMVDIKASNYLISRVGVTIQIKMVDFDSAVPLSRLRHQKRFLCSSETAPPELLSGNGAIAGCHSDVYSIAAMMYRMIRGVSWKQEIENDFPAQSGCILSEWTPDRQRRLYCCLADALHSNPKTRTATCEILETRLRELL